MLNGEYIHMYCAAHILNLIVFEGLKEMNSSIDLIQYADKGVKSFARRLSKFKEVA